ncbi:DUF885 family protein [Novosphingobium sp. ZN18A2]|uniref:DUF885 domain-containing protein n=1 Tax=Novosphingobium sp. ZN18A2 TaxID=3079861 RepID=UPI0030D237F2
MERRQFLAASGLALAWGMAGPARALAAQAEGDVPLVALMDRIFWGGMRLSPMSMTALGLDKGTYASARARLDDFSPAGDAAGTAFTKDMLAATRALDPTGFSDTGKLRRQIVESMLETQLMSEPFPIPSVGAPYRLSQQDGAYFSIPDFLNSTHPIETREDAEAYLSRLSQFPMALDEQTAWQREEAARGYAAPGWSLDLVAGQIGKLLEPAAADSGMVSSLESRCRKKEIHGEWASKATKIVEEGVYPALRRQLALVKKMRGTTRAGDGVWRVPQGAEIYSRALKMFTTTDMGAEEIHQLGLQQVAELSAQLDTILKASGMTQGTVGARLTALNSRPEQLYANDDEGRAALIAELNRSVQAMMKKLPQAFATIPGQPLEIRRVPPEIQDGAPNGYYNPASLDGSRPAIYWINLKSTGDWPKYTLPSLTYHEGVPGHHLHGSILQEDKHLPLLLKNYWNSAYGEGWALYAEMLADELGGYQGLEKAGALQSWLFRAVRLVVDTGLNAKRWSVKQATDYMVEHTGFPRARAQREIERYCASPGQACSYKIGQNTWMRLRAQAEGALGDKFDIRQFHEILKQGVMPLNLLEQQVDAWVTQQTV